MRVMVLIPGHDWGGAERASGHVAEQLTGRGHQIVVGAPSGSRIRAPLAGYPQLAVPIDPSWKWSGPVASGRMLLARSDVIYSNHRWPTLLAGIAKLAGGAPVVYHMQSMVQPRLGTWWGDRTIAVSRSIADHAISHGADPERVVVVPNGARHRDADHSKVEAWPDPGGLRLITVGRLVPGKGLEHLLDALPAVPNASLLILGDGSKRGALEERARFLGVEDRTRFLGWVDDPWPYQCSADVGIAPADTYPEGLPLVAAEMMMAALPVIVTDIPGIREMVTNDEHGLVIPPGDPNAIQEGLMRLLEPRERERLGTAARDHARTNFDARENAERVARVIEELACWDEWALGG